MIIQVHLRVGVYYNERCLWFEGTYFMMCYFSLHQLGLKNLQNVVEEPITLDKASRIVQDVFISAAERDIYTGDEIHIMCITADGIKEERVALRKD